MKPPMQKLLTELAKLLSKIEDDNLAAKIEITFQNGVPVRPLCFTEKIDL